MRLLALIVTTLCNKIGYIKELCQRRVRPSRKSPATALAKAPLRRRRAGDLAALGTTRTRPAKWESLLCQNCVR